MARALILTVALAACTQFPDLDRATSAAAQDADYPALVPIAPLLTRRVGPAPERIQQNIEGRAAALRARAARLRGAPVIDSATRRRMRAGLG